MQQIVDGVCDKGASMGRLLSSRGELIELARCCVWITT